MIQESRPGASFTTVDFVSLKTNVDLPTSQLSAARQSVKLRHAKRDTQNTVDTKRRVGKGPHVSTGMTNFKIILIITRYLRMIMKHSRLKLIRN